MKLNAEQLSIMEEVRDIMYMDAVSDTGIPFVSCYICFSIMTVVRNRGYPVNGRWTKDMELRQAIQSGIPGFSAFGGYILHKLTEIADAQSESFLNACLWGRLAWLDKIVEDGEILEELLPGSWGNDEGVVFQ
jgi:hypothetical protein